MVSESVSSNLIDFSTEILPAAATTVEYVNGAVPNPRAPNPTGGSGHRDPFDMSELATCLDFERQIKVSVY